MVGYNEQEWLGATLMTDLVSLTAGEIANRFQGNPKAEGAIAHEIRIDQSATQSISKTIIDKSGSS